MAAGNWKLHNKAKLHIGDGTIDLDSGAFRMVLLTAYTQDLAHDTWSDVSATENATAAGYTANGAAITQSWTESSGTATFSSAAATEWTATGAPLAADVAMIVQDADANAALAAGDLIVCSCILDTTGGGTTVTASTGNKLTIGVPATGFVYADGAAT
jgi:hypothetical protein